MGCVTKDNAVVRWPGSTHDAKILRESELCRHFDVHPPAGVLLGDSRYPLKSWLMEPYLNPVTDAQRRFNRKPHVNTQCYREMQRST